MPATADVILAGRDGSVTAFNSVPGVKLRDPHGDPVRFSLGSGGGSAKLAALVDRSITEITAADLADLGSQNWIGAYAFACCQELERIEIPAGVIWISFNAFDSCVALTDVSIPEGVTQIDERAFAGCYELQELTLPASLTNLGSAVFEFSGIVKIRCLATTPPTLQATTFQGLDASCDFYVPAASVSAYKTAPYWSARAAHIYADEGGGTS